VKRALGKTSSRRGAAITEFALVLPLLVLIVFATIETCSMMYLQQSLKIAAYEGARIALVPGTTSGNVQAAVNQVLDDRHIGSATVTITPGNYSSAAVGTYIRVTASAPAKGNSLVGAWFYGGKTLQSSVEMMKET
jgi:Flp pilus assembly protein TadG